MREFIGIEISGIDLETGRFGHYRVDELISLLKESDWYDEYVLKKTLDDIFGKTVRTLEECTINSAVGSRKSTSERKQIRDIYIDSLKLVACELLCKKTISLWRNINLDDYCGKSPKEYLRCRFKEFPPYALGKPFHTTSITQIFLEYLTLLRCGGDQIMPRINIRDAVRDTSEKVLTSVLGDEQVLARLLYTIATTIPYKTLDTDKRGEFLRFLKDELPADHRELIDKIGEFAKQCDYRRKEQVEYTEKLAPYEKLAGRLW